LISQDIQLYLLHHHKLKKEREKKSSYSTKKYENADISVGKIAENLNIDREEVLSLRDQSTTKPLQLPPSKS